MPTVCAVLVTYNRASLLRESLAALRIQSRAPAAILVIDNASTDGTAELLSREFPDVVNLRLPRNIGSSGGYYTGIQWAYERGFDWIWTLDDDSIANPDALEALFDCRDRFVLGTQPDLLASKINWIDGSLHPMNIQKPKLYDPTSQFLAAEHGAMSIRFTSFVSMLLHRRLIQRYGLPIPGYFMWNDDVEYSARILRKEFGVMTPASVVVHKTKQKHVPATSTGAKYFYEVRNKLWIIRHSDGFDHGEKWWMGKSLARRTWRHLCDTRFNYQSLEAIGLAIGQGLTSRPVETMPVETGKPFSKAA